MRREIPGLRHRSTLGGDRQPLALVRDGPEPDVRGSARSQPRFAPLHPGDVRTRRAGLSGRTRSRHAARLRLCSGGERHRSLADAGGLSSGAVQGHGGRHHGLERQDRHQGMDSRRTARGHEVLPLAQELQFAVGGAAFGADAGGRRTAGHLRGGDFAARRNGTPGTHHPPRRGDIHLDRRRAPGTFPQPGTEVRRKTDTGAQRVENHLS